MSRGVIEIIEERFLGDRRSSKFKNLSHQEKMEKELAVSEPKGHRVFWRNGEFGRAIVQATVLLGTQKRSIDIVGCHGRCGS